MKRQEIESQYNVDTNGIIRSLGKFEGEMLYAPYFYEAMLNGESDHVNGIDYFKLEAKDKLEFPELIGVYGVILGETDQGFVSIEATDSEQDFNYDKLMQSKYGI